MPSTYTTNGGIELPANGEQSGTWGETVNDNMAIIDRLTNGVGAVSLSGTTHTLTTTDGTLSDGQYNVLVLGGSPSGTNTITISPNDGEHVYVVKNASGQTATFTQGSGANVSVLNNTTKIIYADGAGAGAAVVDITGALDLGSLIIAGTSVTATAAELNILDGVTATAAELNLLDGSIAGTVVNSKAVIYGAAGQVEATTVEFDNLSGTGAVSVTNILDEDNMASDSATALATQQSIKAYVDAQVDTVDTLAEILAIGNTTGGTDIVASTTDKVQFRDAAIYINSSVDGQLDIVADTEIQIAATTVDLNGALDVSGTALVTGVLTTTAATVSNGGGQFNGAINVGVDDTGYDVKFFGATAGAYMLWDESADDLILGGAAGLSVNSTALVTGVLTFNGGFASNADSSIATAAGGALSLTSTDVSVNADQLLGKIEINSSDGSGSGSGVAASIQAVSDEAFTGQGRPSSLIFSTFTSGSALAEKLKIDNAGNIIIANSGGTLYTTTAGASNFRAGVNAGNSIASGGNYNVFVGDEAGTAITTGDHNVAIGFSALDAEDGGTASVAIGSYALSSQNADGDNYNTAVGYVAGSDITSGVQNTLIGAAAGDALTDADNNVALGYASLSAETNNNGNTAIGAEALMSQNVGGGGDARNTAVGFAAGTSVTSGIKNTLIGGRSGDALINADSNVAVGESALGSDTYGSGSVAIGDSALYSQNFTSAATSFNTAVGYAAGNSTTTGQSNVFVGYNSGQFNSTGYANTFVGSAAGTGVTGARITGSSNTAVGTGAGNDLQGAASDNTFLGGSAGGQVTTGVYNTFLGSGAGLKVATGGTNICIGGAAGGEITTGQNNIMMGYIAGRHGVNLVDGDNNLLLGSYTDTTATDTDNANVIGYNVTGEGGFTTLGVNADDIRAAHGTATWTTVSDERYKKDIVDSTAGLSFINALQPRTFKYKNLGELPETFRAYKADSTDVFKNSDTNHGFIAQEVKTAIDADSGIKDGFKLWAERDDGSQEVGEAALIPILTKAVQELSTALDAALARIAVLEG
jgi:hypothetical protein